MRCGLAGRRFSPAIDTGVGDIALGLFLSLPKQFETELSSSFQAGEQNSAPSTAEPKFWALVFHPKGSARGSTCQKYRYTRQKI